MTNLQALLPYVYNGSHGLIIPEVSDFVLYKAMSGTANWAIWAILFTPYLFLNSCQEHHSASNLFETMLTLYITFFQHPTISGRGHGWGKRSGGTRGHHNTSSVQEASTEMADVPSWSWGCGDPTDSPEKWQIPGVGVTHGLVKSHVCDWGIQSPVERSW